VFSVRPFLTMRMRDSDDPLERNRLAQGSMRRVRRLGRARRHGLCFSSDTLGRLDPSLPVDRYCAEATR
jgi:hypothetical protein